MLELALCTVSPWKLEEAILVGAERWETVSLGFCLADIRRSLDVQVWGEYHPPRVCVWSILQGHWNECREAREAKCPLEMEACGASILRSSAGTDQGGNIQNLGLKANL